MAEKCLKELRHAMLTKKSPESISLSVEKLASLLPLSTPSENPTPSQIKSLNELLSRSMLALYKIHPMPALKLAASIFTEVFKSRISPLAKLESSAETNKALMLWETVLDSVLNGIQSYIDFEHADLVSLGTATYKPLIGILSSSPLPKISARLRVQAYLMLSDAAEGCSENRKILRDKKVLGGSRLGGMIVATNEYLVLDALFQLLARLTPSASDPEGRAALAAEVFQNPKAKKAFGKDVCEKLTCTFKNAKGREWDKAIENIVAEMAKTDLHRTQPFRVIGNFQANSLVYLQNPPLDYVYIDSNGFVVNVQDGENIDSLEIDYMSVISIHIAHSSGKTPNAVIHIKVSLSSPPMKGSEPISSSESQGHYFSFDVDSNDHDRLSLALKARDMGEYIQQTNSQSRTKRSMGTLDFNNITITTKSLAEKAEIVQHLYVNSSPKPRVVEDTIATKIDDIVELPLQPKHEMLTGNPTTPDNLEDTGMKEVTACPKKNPGTVCPQNVKAKKPRPKPLAKPTKKAVLDDSDEPLTDIELLGSTFPSKAVKTDKDLNVERQGLSANLLVEPGANDFDAQKNASISFSKPQNSLKAMKSHKRKRVIESSDDEEAENQDGKTQNQTNLPYNSQLLLQTDTATTRSSIKYRARAKKAPSPLPAIDCDIVPAAVSIASSSPILASKSTAKRQRKEVKTAPEENKATNEYEKSRHEKKVAVDPAEKSKATRKIQLTSVKPPLDDIEKRPEVKLVIKDVGTDRTKGSTLIATNEKPKKSKKSPWKDLDYFVTSDDLARSSDMPSKVPMVPLEKPAVLKPDTPSSPFNGGSERAEEVHHIPHQGQDEKRLPSSIAPRNSGAPDLDLDIADTGSLDIDANFDLDLVLSAGDMFDAPLSVSAISDVRSDHKMFGGKMIEPAVKNVDPEDDQPFSIKHTKAETSFTHADVVVIDANNRAQEPSRDTIMIDLTCVDEESSQEEKAAIRHHEEEPSLRKGSPNKSTSKRSRVSFAHDTKPPSIIKKSAYPIKTTPFSFSGKATVASMIPRLAMRSDASVFLKEDGFIGRQLKQQNTKIFRKPQTTSTPVVETDSEDEDRVINSDDKIVAVLNKIQEVIVHRMNTKFDVPKMQAHAARERLLASSAQDLEVMLKECFHHSEKLVRLEVEYAEHGRKARRSLEDLNRMNEDIDKRLRQIILEHDRHGLSKKMSKVLVAPPQIFCS